nr:hypothetical protein asmbl_5 [uncultured bacterium]
MQLKVWQAYVRSTGRCRRHAIRHRPATPPAVAMSGRLGPRRELAESDASPEATCPRLRTADEYGNRADRTEPVTLGSA